MSRSRARKRAQLVRHTQNGSGATTATTEREPFVLIPLDNEITPILEAGRTTRNARANRVRNGMRSISQAWDDTEALGITADMRRSGPGMLSDQDRKDTLYKAYLNSVWISACVEVISKRITSGGYTIEYCGQNEKPTPEEEAQKEQLQAFIEYTNDDEEFLQLVRAIVTDILIYGECFVEVVKQNGVPYSLHKVDCVTMNYQLDRHGNIVKYIQNLYHSTETIEFAPEDIIRFWLPSPFASKVALSPIERIMGSIDADVHMADWVRTFFRKGARPNFWIKFPGSKEEADRFVTWLRENYTGMANAHVPLVLYDEAELYEIGKGSVDVDFLKGRELMCKEILAGYQVPPALVGLIESGNIGGGTGESQEKSFLRNACDPLRAMVMGQINYRITRQGFNITCWKIGTHYADYRDDTVVSEIQDRRIRNGSMSINEVRRDMNRPPVDGGDTNMVVTSREIQPLDRLPQLSDEQAAQAAAATAHVQAQATLAQAQADKLKEPPPEPTPPSSVPPAQPSPDEQGQAQERVILRRQLSALLERLEQRDRSERVRQDAVQFSRGPEELPSQISEALTNIEEQLRALRARNVTPRKQTRRKSADLAESIRMQIASGQTEEGGFYVEPETTEAAPMISQRGTCGCPVCQAHHDKPISDGQAPPYHEGCDCRAVAQGEEAALSESTHDRLRKRRAPSAQQEEIEQQLKAALSHLYFSKDGTAPSQEEKEAAAQKIASLLAQAKQIGQAHASDKAEEGLAWGGSFRDLLQSAWDIVTNFVGRVVDWISGQDAEDLTEEAIEAKVESIAETVGDFEVASCIEQAVMATLQAQGEDTVVWVSQPGACSRCQANHDQGPVPIGSAFESGDTTPPAHPSCRCSLAIPDEED